MGPGSPLISPGGAALTPSPVPASGPGLRPPLASPSQPFKPPESKDWLVHPNTGGNSPSLNLLFPLLPTTPPQSSVTSLLVILGPRFSQMAVKCNWPSLYFGDPVKIFLPDPLSLLHKLPTALPPAPCLLQPPFFLIRSVQDKLLFSPSCPRGIAFCHSAPSAFFG